MKNQKHLVDLVRRVSPLDLPLKIGMSDGSYAHLVTDAKDKPIGAPYSIITGLTVEEARQHAVVGPQLMLVEYMLNAINQHETLVAVLKIVAATSSQPRLTRLAQEALDELKE